MKKNKRAKRIRGAEKNNVNFAVQCPECGTKISQPPPPKL